MRLLVERTEAGLYCPPGDFHIDPWLPVERAVITHAHADHAREGSQAYLAAEPGARLLAERLGPEASITPVPYGQSVDIDSVRVSLHPAGHILGSAQVRLECRGEVWVVSGDYKTAPDPTCPPLEPLRCHTFVTESTYGLPIYRWQPATEVLAEIDAWWRANQSRGWTSILYAYPLGKAQRLLASIDASAGPILAHGAVLRFLAAYKAAGVCFPEVRHAEPVLSRSLRGRALVLAPPSAVGSPWLRQFGPVSAGFTSGWMQIRGARRRRALDRGFVLSDHADWNGLIETIRATRAEHVVFTHGYTAVLARWFEQQGWKTTVVPTRFEGDIEQDPDTAGTPA